MAMLTITNARQKPGFRLKKAPKGEDPIISLRPVQVESADYATREYGVTEKELDHYVKRSQAEVKRDRKAVKLNIYKGNLNALLAA